MEAFESPNPDTIRVEEARERIGLVFERGMKIPLQYEESIEIRHDVIRFLFPNLPAEIQRTPTDICDKISRTPASRLAWNEQSTQMGTDAE